MEKGKWKIENRKWNFELLNGSFSVNGIIDILYKPRIEKTFMAFIDKVEKTNFY